MRCTSPVKRAHTQNAPLQSDGLMNVQHTKPKLQHILYVCICFSCQDRWIVVTDVNERRRTDLGAVVELGSVILIFIFSNI